MKNNKGFGLIGVLIIIVVLLAIGGAYYFGKSSNNNVLPQNEGVNNPIQQNVPVQNIPVNNNPVSTTLPTPYITAQSGWPPVIKDSGEAYSCKLSHTEMGDTIIKTINKRDYCVTTTSDGTAGSFYYTYTYKTFGIQGSTIFTTFTLRYVDCGVYRDNSSNGGVQYNECKNRQSEFNSNLDDTVDSLISNQNMLVPNLISFSGCGGNFSATSSGLTSVKIYSTSTGTETISQELFGTMNLVGTSGGIQTWSLPASSLLATSINASGYNGPTMTNQKDYPFAGASTIHEHLFGVCLH